MSKKIKKRSFAIKILAPSLLLKNNRLDFSALWCTTWQLCCENHPNDLGDVNTLLSAKICVNLS